MYGELEEALFRSSQNNMAYKVSHSDTAIKALSFVKLIALLYYLVSVCVFIVLLCYSVIWGRTAIVLCDVWLQQSHILIKNIKLLVTSHLLVLSVVILLPQLLTSKT